MNHDIVSLGDVCEFLDNQRVPITESDRKPGPYPYYGANGQQDSIDNYIFDEPLVLLAEDGGYFGSKDRPIAYKVTGKCWVNNHAHVLRPKSNIDVDYLHRVLSYYDVTKYVNGTTRQKLTKGNAENISFPLPPLTEQKRIASLLARADRLRQLRRTAHDLGDALLQSVFLEMFGDVKLNQKGWDVFPLEEIVQPGRIITYGIVQAGPHIEDGIPYIRTGDIKEGQIVVDGLLRTSKEIAAKYKRSEVKAGELVMSIRATVGTIAELPPQLDGANLTQGTARISPGSKLNKKFLLYAIRSQGTQKLIEDRVKGATFREITLEALREVPMIVPPLSLQEEFAGVVARVESLRWRMGESTRQVEGLFESLLAEAFEA